MRTGSGLQSQTAQTQSTWTNVGNPITRTNFIKWINANRREYPDLFFSLEPHERGGTSRSSGRPGTVEGPQEIDELVAFLLTL